MSDETTLVPIGRVGRPHGLDGAFVVEDASDDERRWRVGETVLVGGEPATIEVVRRVGGGRRAIRLDRPVERGAQLAVRVSELPALEPDSYYAFQLVGLEVVDEADERFGHVVEVHPGVANDNLELDDGTLVPLIEDAVRTIDLAAGGSSCAVGSSPDPSGRSRSRGYAARGASGRSCARGTLDRRARRRLHAGPACIRLAHGAEAAGDRARL